MGLLSRIMGREIRERPLLADPYFSDFMAMRSHGFATSDNVLSNLAVAARCVALRSEMLSTVFRYSCSAEAPMAAVNAPTIIPCMACCTTSPTRYKPPLSFEN